MIRRMRCEDCRKIHHELPDILVPYKRYSAESIEQVVSGTAPIDVAADESTLYRWHQWFQAWAPYAIGCIRSIAKRFHWETPERNSSNPPQAVLREIGREEGTPTGWLANIVRPIANIHLWVHTRSAFLSGVG